MLITPILGSRTHQPSNPSSLNLLKAKSIKQALRRRAAILRLEEGPAHITLPLISYLVMKETNKNPNT